MSPEAALNLLTQATANLRLSRKDHQLVIEALDTLEAAITAKPEPKNDTARDS